VLSVLSSLKDRNDETKFSESLPCSISEQSVKSWDTWENLCMAICKLGFNMTQYS